MTDSLRKSALKGIIWSSFERMSGQLVGFVVIVIMSRILTKSEYGLVGMLLIFIDVAQTLADSGVTQALIRKPDRTQIDCSTAFIFNVSLSIALYLILFFAAPFIAGFYGQPVLTGLTRVLSLSVLLNALMMVQKALFTVNIDFKTQAKASLTAAILSGILGIWMAYGGYGVWAIVYYQLANLGFTAILLWLYSKWRPSLVFSYSSFRYFFGFGSRLTVAGVIHTVYRNMYLVAIGKFYKPASVGLYTRAHQFGSLPSYNVNNIIQRVTYPILCNLQDDTPHLVDVFIKFVRLTSFVVFPMMTGLSILATPIVRILLGGEWEYAGTLLSIMCLFMMWMPVDSLNLNLLQVKGRTDCYLRCEIWKKIFGVAILIITIPMGLEIICWGQVVRALADLVVDSYYTRRFYGLGIESQLLALIPSMLYSAVSGLAVWLTVSLLHEDWLKLIVGIPEGILIYFLMAKITSSTDLNEFKSLIIKKRIKES